MLKTQEERQGAILCPDDRRGGTIPPAPSAFRKRQINHRTPHDLYHTQQMKTYDTIGVQDKVEGRFVD